MINRIIRFTSVLKTFPNRHFNSKIDRVLKRIPILGKMLSSLFGVFELSILELFRRLDKKFNIYMMGIVNKYFLMGRWGGRVVPLVKI